MFITEGLSVQKMQVENRNYFLPKLSQVVKSLSTLLKTITCNINWTGCEEFNTENCIKEQVTLKKFIMHHFTANCF